MNSWPNSLDGPIREIVEYNGEILFATQSGIARYDPLTETWLDSWTIDNGGLHPDSFDDEIIEFDSSSTNMDSGLKRFITYDSLSEFSFHVSGPLMMVYWLRDLKFDYIELAILINVSQVLGLFSMR